QLNKEQGVTLVRVTHDTEEIQQAQQVIRIVAGKVSPTDGFSS
ncbi:spermidine/putrescine ABC transporter ATP-binding protein, partial [Enterococcus faecalis]